MSQKKAGKIGAEQESISIQGKGPQEVVSAQDAIDKMQEIGARGSVQVMYGVYDESLLVGGHTVKSVRASIKDAANIPDDAAVYVDGELVDENYVLQSGNNMEFVKQAGVKG